MKSFFTKNANVSDFSPSLNRQHFPSYSTKWIFPLGLMMAILMLSAGNIWGQTVIAGWDFSPLTGGSGNYGPSPLAATTEDANVSIGGITRADGIGTSGSGAANAWGGNDFEEGTDLASGISNNNFVTFTITVHAGWSLDLEEIEAYNIRRSGTGPTTGQWQYQVGIGSFVNLSSEIIWGGNTNAAGNAQVAIDLSGESALQNIPAGTVVTFRIVSWSASSAGGTWYINDPADTGADDLVIRGTVSECTTPPSTGAPLAATTCAGVGVNVDGNPSGGVAPYTHLWTNLGTGTATGVSLMNETSQIVTASASGISGGTIELEYKVTDSEGCIGTKTVTVTVNPAPTGSIAVDNNPVCYGTNVTFTASPGMLTNYDFKVNGMSEQSSASNTYNNALLEDGWDVSVEATDANGCMADFGTITMLVYDLPVPVIGAQTNVSCYGASDGSVIISGGDEYKLGADPYQISGTFSGLPAGPYTITVRDANQCTATIIVTITEPTILSAMVAATQPTCFGTDDGTITISSPMGGSNAFDYSIDGGTSWTADLSNTGLAPGTYNVRIRDENHPGCVIDLGNQVLAYPAALSATAVATDVTCFGDNDGTITISNQSGGSGSYQYSISGGFTYENAPAYINLAPGMYNVRMRDMVHQGCFVIINGSLNITEPTVLSATVNKMDATCFGANDGTITVSAPMGGYGTYEYRLDMGSWQMGGSFTGLAPGVYNVQIRDAAHLACIIDLGDQTITEPAQVPVAPITGSNYLYVGGTSQLANATPMGLWGTSDASVASISVSGLVTGNTVGTAIISYTVTDNMNCTNSASLTITVDEPIIDIGLFNFNSPTPAGYNKLKVKIRPIIDVNNANYTSGIFTIRCKSSDNVQFTNADIVSASFGYYLETTALNVDDNGTDYNYFTFFFENAQQYVTWAEDVEVDVLTLRYPCGAASFEIVTNDAWTSINNANYYQELAGAAAERIIYQPTAASPTALSLSETHENILCGEVNTGSIDLTVLTGLAPYAYIWSNGATTEDVMDLAAGTYTVSVTDGNGCTAALVTTIQYLPVTNVSDMPNTHYPTIQAAIDAATTVNGETLEICAGTYPEFVTVNKELIIKGPKALVDGCDGSRGTGEAIVVPASAAINFGEIFHIAASNVTITGFTIDGDNTAVTSGFSSTNGADIDAAEGVTVYETGINNLTVTNNVFKNLSYFGVTLYDYPAGVPSSGHLIANNKLQDFGTYDPGSTIEYWGGGVLLYNNQYAAVTDNCMDNLRIGVQTGNFYQANPGLPASQVIEGNTMTNIRRLGVFHNLQYSSASAYTVSDNSISGVSNANETKWNGVLLASLSVPSTISGNLVNASAVTQPSSGIEVWNVKNTNPASISGGTITDASTGVFVNNFDGYSSNATDGAHASLSNITINTKALGTGIRVYDNPASTHANVQATIGNGIVVNNGARGLVVENPAASIVGATLSNLVFVGQTINYIELIDNAGNLDAAAVLFDSETGATASLAENFIIEDKIVHKIDEGALGFVLVSAGEDFVTPQSFTANTLIPSIQRGVDAASNGFIVNVAAGTYTDNVVINKEVSILGAGKALTIVQPLISDPNCGGMGGGSLCPGASNVMLVQANNVSIQELTIDGDNPGLSGIVVNGADVDARNGIISDYTMGVFNNLLVNNVGAKNIFLRGIYAASGGTFTFSNNMVQNVRGTAGSIGMFNFGGSGTMTNNMVTDCNDGIASNWSTGTTYSGNTVSNSGSGIHTDNNGGSGGVVDVISNNTVLNSDVNGYGIWVFAPYVDVQVTDNTVTNVDVGLANAGQFGTVTTSFLRNTVDGMNKANSTGVYQTTDLFGFGTNNVSGIYLNNFITNTTTGFQIDYQTGNTNTITANNNSITGNTTGVVLGITAGTLVDDFTCNWWGSSAAAAVAAAVNAAVDYTPWGIDGTDSAPMTNGFQPTPGTCLGTPIMILTAVPDHIICGEASNSGTIEVTFSGGSPSYTVDWGGTPATMLAGSPYNITGLMAGTYNVTVTDTYGSSTSTMVVVEYLPVTNVSDMPNTYYPSIQAAIDAVTTVNGETIEVCVGIYTENIVVNKSLTILGPQANADADTRFAAFTGGPANPKADPLLEAILTPANNNPTGGNPGANDQIRVLVSGVTINGFVIDGNNPDIAGASGTQINGVEIDGRRALTNVDNANNVVAINNLNVRHNILQNFGQRAVSLSGAGSLTGNVITENVIRNFLEQGVLLLTNAYVDVTNNTIEVPGSAIGLHLQNFNLNGSMSWTGNNVTVGQDAFGIHANLFYAPLGTLNINNNTVNAASGVTGASDETWGINVWSVSTGANVALNNNFVGNAGGEFGRGINLWNLPTSNTVSITGGTVGKSVIGINLDNVDPYYGAGNNTTVNVTGTSVTGGTIGIRVRTEVLPVAPLFAPNIVAGNSILHLSDIVVDGAATGIQIKAPAASAPFTATGVVDQDSEVKDGATAGLAVVGSQAFATIQNNDAAISITGNLIGVEVDGGTATVYRNRIDANGTGIRAINGGNLSAVIENFITNNTSEGVRIEANAGTIGGINFNDISENTTYSIHNLLATPAVDATCNWYGTDNPNVFDAFIIGGVNYAPYLNAGLDNESLTPGFQPAPMTCVELTDFYVNDDFTAGDLITTAVGLDGPGTRGTVNRPYRHINTAINAAANGNTIRVDVGTYSDEQVLVDKDLTILGTTGSPAAKPIINFTGTPDPMESLDLFRVTYPGVTIHNFEFQPDVSKLGSAIIASDAVNGVSDLTILNNTVNPYRSSGVTVAYSLLNAININYGSHRVNSSNPVNLLVEGNTVAYNVGADMMPGTADDAGFRAGVAVDEGTGTFTANTLQTINQDIEVRFTNTANDVNITNNNINGGGVNFAAPNNGGGNLNITGNTFDGAAGNTYTSSLRVKDNIDAAAMTTLIQNNTFINHNWGISLENYKEVTVNNNTFTPASMSTTFRHITLNTKELNTSSATVTQTDIDGTFTSNKFYGSGVSGGKGMVFLNHDSDDDGYGVFTVGGAGALANEFSSEIAVFMEMDQSSGPSWPSAFPENNLGAGAITTMDCWAEDINIEQNTFDVGAGQQLPINMTGPQRATLETKLYHEPDSACLGLFIYFKPIEVTAKVYLQGPYDTGTNKMADALRQISVGPLFPLSTPYDTMPDFVKVNNYVMETITTAVRDNSDPDNAIVDWVWVELRAANEVTVVATRSALLQRDGDIVDMDGTSEVQFPDTYEGNYFLMIRHRNHLGAMTNAMVSYVGGSPFVDFSDPALVTKGVAPTSARKLLETGVYGLWAGNVNQKDNNNNWRILYNGSQNDRNEILKRVGLGTPLNIVQGYYHEDVNMNGETKYSGSGNDRVIILNNLGASNPLGNITQEPNN